MAETYEASTVKQLKEIAAEKGITVKSTLRKADIIEKLREHDAANEASPKAAAIETTEDAPAKEVEDALSQESPPAAVEVAPKQVSALDEPSKEPTPPPHHHPEILPAGSSKEPEPELPTADEPMSATETIPLSEDTTVVAPPADSSLPSGLATPIPTIELIEDSRKRKRRSLTPPLDAQDMEAKRTKIDANTDADLSFTEAPTEEQEDVKGTLKEGADIAEKSKNTSIEASREPARPSKNVRELFNADVKAAARAAQYTPQDGATDEVPIDPARHLATSALYISNLKRPLHEGAMKKHLESLAAPNASDDNPSSIELFHLDQIKTHALVLFANVTAASRVRAALHNQKYPEEASREPLFVDFIPSEKVSEWITRENGTDGAGRGGARFQVIYTPAGQAIHQEVGGSVSAPSGPRRPSFPVNVPTGPRNTSISSPSVPPRFSTSSNAIQQPERQQPVFKALEDRFNKTTAKPMIYFKPVSDELVARRLAEMKDLTARDWEETRRTEDMEEMRFTFEEGDRLVNTGRHNTSKMVRARERDLLREKARKENIR